jgi:hypothetical protein
MIPVRGNTADSGRGLWPRGCRYIKDDLGEVPPIRGKHEHTARDKFGFLANSRQRPWR